jgi:hypothetical protein
MHRFRTFALAFAALFALSLPLAGCGDKTKTITEVDKNGQTVERQVADVHFAKTKFVLHTGLAVGAFHRYIYKPYQAGTFSGATPRTERYAAYAKAALATAFISHELKLAKRSAESDDRLRPLADKISAVERSVTQQAGNLKNNIADPSSLLSINTLFGGLIGDAKSAGATVKELTPPALQ